MIMEVPVMKRIALALMVAAALTGPLFTAGCVIVPARPYRATVWVPGHWHVGYYGGRAWVPGYWRRP